ncbi:MAG TPA: thiolase family protein [Oculatellaceae cyanobacterium]
MTVRDSARSAVIVDGLRTPFGRYGGILKDFRPDDLCAWTIQEILKRNPQIPVDQIDDILVGCANQAGEDNRNVARMAVLLAGLPVSIPGGTVNRLCGSSLMAVNDAACAIMAGAGEIYLAGGVESMTRAPFVLPKAPDAFSRHAEIYDTTIGWRFTNPKLAEQYFPYSMGETAENVAERYGISREAQDAYALASQQKTQEAIRTGKFKAEIVPFPVTDKKGQTVFYEQDEHPRPGTTLETLASLKPAFKKDGTVTAGNSSGINDGAGMMLILSEKKALELGCRPLARILSTAVAGVDPAIMGMGPVPASQKALQKAGLTVQNLDLVELNEAFAAQVLACAEALQLNPDTLNVNGGGIAIGHPLGASGSRILTTLTHELQRRPHARYGLATMCIGVGQGIATVIEKYDA